MVWVFFWTNNTTIGITAGSSFISNLPFYVPTSLQAWGVFGDAASTAFFGGLQAASASTQLYFATSRSGSNSISGSIVYQTTN